MGKVLPLRPGIKLPEPKDEAANLPPVPLMGPYEDVLTHFKLLNRLQEKLKELLKEVK